MYKYLTIIYIEANCLTNWITQHRREWTKVIERKMDVRERTGWDKTQTVERGWVSKKIVEEVSDIGQDRTAGIHTSEMHGIEHNIKTVVRFQWDWLSTDSMWCAFVQERWWWWWLTQNDACLSVLIINFQALSSTFYRSPAHMQW